MPYCAAEVTSPLSISFLTPHFSCAAQSRKEAPVNGDVSDDIGSSSAKGKDEAQSEPVGNCNQGGKFIFLYVVCLLRHLLNSRSFHPARLLQFSRSGEARVLYQRRYVTLSEP